MARARAAGCREIELGGALMAPPSREVTRYDGSGDPTSQRRSGEMLADPAMQTDAIGRLELGIGDVTSQRVSKVHQLSLAEIDNRLLHLRRGGVQLAGGRGVLQRLGLASDGNRIAMGLFLRRL